MGKPMAMNILKKGYQVTVWNRTVSKAADLISAGARIGKSPIDAVREAAVVILMLENGAVVTDMLFRQGVADACREGTLVIDMSSIAPAIAEDHARLLARAGLVTSMPLCRAGLSARRRLLSPLWPAAKKPI